MDNKFTSGNQSDQLAAIRKDKEEGWSVVVKRVTTYFLFVFLCKEESYKYLVYSYDIEAERIYVQDEKAGSASELLFYFCNRCIDGHS